MRAPADDVDLSSGGRPLLIPDDVVAVEDQVAPDDGEQLLLGKRYGDDDLGLKLPCIASGPGALRVNGQPMGLKGDETAAGLGLRSDERTYAMTANEDPPAVDWIPDHLPEETKRRILAMTVETPTGRPSIECTENLIRHW